MKFPEKFREKNPATRSGFSMNSQKGDTFGWFKIPLHNKNQEILHCLVTDGTDDWAQQVSEGQIWEHLSVHVCFQLHGRETFTRIPTWDEMCILKNLFWSADDCVVQYHPPTKDYVNNYATCLHLWCLRSQPIMRPPAIFVGVK